MATGTGNLPYPGKSYTPFDILTAEELNEDVANIESLADGTGIGDGAIKTVALEDEAVTAPKIDFATLPQATADANGWTVVDLSSVFGIKIATKRITFSNTIGVAPSAATLTLSSSNIPVGMANITNTRWSYSLSITNGNAFNVNANPEMATNATSLNFTATKVSGTSGTVSGFIDIIMLY